MSSLGIMLSEARFMANGTDRRVTYRMIRIEGGARSSTAAENQDRVDSDPSNAGEQERQPDRRDAVPENYDMLTRSRTRHFDQCQVTTRTLWSSPED